MLRSGLISLLAAAPMLHSTEATTAVYDLSTLLDGVTGFEFVAPQSGMQYTLYGDKYESVRNLAVIGDINDDGFKDFAFGYANYVHKL